MWNAVISLHMVAPGFHYSGSKGSNRRTLHMASRIQVPSRDGLVTASSQRNSYRIEVAVLQLLEKNWSTLSLRPPGLKLG